MKKIRTVGEMEAITRFMYVAYQGGDPFYPDTIPDYDDLKTVERLSWRDAVEALLNHLENVEELELQ